MNSKTELLTVAHLTNVIDGRSNSGTARVAQELISQLALRPNVRQVFIHFQESHEKIYQLPRTREIIIPLKKFPIASQFFSFIIYWIPKYFSSRQEQFDVVHWHASRVFPFFFLIKSKKVCVTLHDANNRIIRGVNTFWTTLFYWNLRISSGKVNHIFGVSEDACSKLIEVAKFPANKVKRLYMASNFESLEPRKPEGFIHSPGYLICVSRWQNFKNVEILVDAYSLLLKRSTDVPPLILVGKPVAGYDLPLRRIEELSMHHHVTILRDLTDNELAYLYRGALVNIFPSLHEGFGLSILEGLKCGCPSIDHKFTSTSEVSGEAGIHVDMTSSESLYEAISSLLNDPALVQKMKSLATKRAENFTWEETVENLVRFYTS
jgi:glycosyltransferase involved in cell wall biosynthesis